MSLWAWGFHFPAATYADLVQGLMRSGGRVILDVRDDTDGREVLERTFDSVDVVGEFPRHTRFCATKG